MGAGTASPQVAHVSATARQALSLRRRHAIQRRPWQPRRPCGIVGRGCTLTNGNMPEAMMMWVTWAPQSAFARKWQPHVRLSGSLSSHGIRRPVRCRASAVSSHRSTHSFVGQPAVRRPLPSGFFRGGGTSFVHPDGAVPDPRTSLPSTRWHMRLVPRWSPAVERSHANGFGQCRL